MIGSGKCTLVIISVFGLCVVGAEPAWGFSNNGFETDHVFILSAQTGALQEWTEAGVFIKSLTANNTLWYTLTFAGTAANNDARLFVAKHEPHWTQGTVKDVRIAELDSNGNVITGQDVDLGDLLGVTDVYDEVVVGVIRYSSYRNSLFLSASNTTSGSRATAWEIDLDLTTVMNTYTGPSHNEGNLAITINPIGGTTLYMCGRDLNSSGDPHRGDLISFDITYGSTSAYTTLINSDNMVDPTGFVAPRGLAYRGTNNPSGHPTILTCHKNGDHVDGVKEFYLDQTDVKGNLLHRADYFPNKERLVGQLDVLKQSVWLGGRISAQGYVELASNDGTNVYGNTGVSQWWDIASPGMGQAPEFEPVIAEVTPDPVIVATIVPYVQDLVLLEGTPTISWTLLEGPPGAQVVGDDSGATVSGWTPNASDIGSSFEFIVEASNSQGSDLEEWAVDVRSIADFDNDSDVDQEDFGQFQVCFSGSGVSYEAGCEVANLDSDSDVDLDDFMMFQSCLGGPNRPPGC